MSLVLDSSVTLAWIHRDEITPAIRHIFDVLRQDGAWVPGLWRLEVGNALQTGIRRKRRGADFLDVTLVDLSKLPIQVDAETDQQAWGATLELAIRHQLTTYDAAYLELALRRGLQLATLDAALRRAAQAEKVRLLG